MPQHQQFGVFDRVPAQQYRRDREQLPCHLNTNETITRTGFQQAVTARQTHSEQQR